MATKKITDLDRATEPASSDLLLIETSEGTRAIDYEKLSGSIVKNVNSGPKVSTLPVEMHRNIYMGNNLGSSVSDEQWRVIQSGEFTDLFVGDYWIINDHTYRVADVDYLYDCGDTTPFKKHHLIIVPDTNMGNQKMNNSEITTTGYANSKMRTEYMNAAKNTIKNDFGEGHILKYRDLLTNVSANGKASNGAWFDCDIELMNERMVYGSPCFNPTSDGSTIPYNCTVCKSQLALFMLNPKAITTRYPYWLRDVVSATRFAFVYFYGRAYYFSASSSFGVRPFFAIG